jgi:copper chaperone
VEMTELKVDGMTCSGCVRSVTKALTKVPGVSNVDVSLEDGVARVQFDGRVADRAVIRKAVLDAGYSTP